MDQERYFEDFPHSQLSVQNFSYVRRPLGLNNAAYEIVQKPGQNSKEPQGKISNDLGVRTVLSSDIAALA